MSGTVARSLGNLADTLGTTATANVNFDSDGLFVDSVNNRVGIGTSSPTAKLDIASGNLAFSSTAQRITGDFSNATQSNRVFFQTTTAGSGTSVGTIPNATGFSSAFNAFGGPDPGNASFAQLRAGSDTSDVRLTSGITGTGTYYPMAFYTGGSERMRLDTSGNVGIGTASPAVKFAISSTDAMLVPVGTTGQRPTGATGYLRFNNTTTSFEGYNGTAWGSIGGGATGGGVDQMFFLNGQTVTTSYSIPSGQNAGTFGPITIDSSATVTVPSGSTWTVV